jgi:hypothetical protein
MKLLSLLFGSTEQYGMRTEAPLIVARYGNDSPLCAAGHNCESLPYLLQGKMMTRFGT